MASTSSISTQANGGEASALPEPTAHQLSKRQQYDTLVGAEIGAEAAVSLGSPQSHPSYPAVASLCRRYPTQASSIFQTYLDLKNGAAAWDVVEPLALCHPEQEASISATETAGGELSALSQEEAEQLVQQTLAGWKNGATRLGLVNSSPQTNDKDPVLTQGLAAVKGRRKNSNTYEVVIPLSISQHLTTTQLAAIFTLLSHHAADSSDPLDTSHVLLAIIAPDSTLVYYTVSKDMVKPVN